MERLFQLNNGLVEDAVGVCVEKGSGAIDYWIGTAHVDRATDGLWIINVGNPCFQMGYI